MRAPAQRAARPGRGPALAVAVALAVAFVLLAAPGPELVPGAAPDAPRWVLGVFDQGLGLSPEAYLGVLYFAVAAWVAVWMAAGRLGGRAIGWLTGGAIVLFALAPPLLSLDVFSYISYARLGVEEGLNPYESVPAAIPDDPAASRVDDFRFAVSVYGPLFTLGSYPLGAGSVGLALWGFKAVAALSVAAIALLTARLARMRGVAPASAVAFVALNPLVLVHVVGGAHNDGTMVALALAGAGALLAGRPASAGVGLVAAAAVKASGALYAPFAFLGAAGERRRLLAGAIGAAALIGALTLVLFGGSAAEALGVAGDNQATVSRWSVPGTIARVTGIDIDPIRLVFAAAYGLVVLLLMYLTWRGADWVRMAGWAAFGLLVATSWMVPWYVIWLLPLAAVGRDRALLGCSVALTLFQVINAIPL
jgi:hypothetical protein